MTTPTWQEINTYFGQVVPAIDMRTATGVEVEVHYMVLRSTSEIIEQINMWSAAGCVELTSALVILLASLPLEHDEMVAASAPADPLYFT